jgi:hypothetical protein
MFESRTSELTEEEFRKILHEKCKDFVKAPKLLQRSKSSEGPIFSYINPKSFDRAPLKKSDRFTDGVESRHHTLLMDNLPSWSKFPKRSQSVIGLTSADQRVIFGFHRYLIIPFDGAKFGVAPSSDLWSCQVHITDGFPNTSQRPGQLPVLISFNDKFSELMIVNKISDNSYSEMMSDLQKQYDEWLKDSFSAIKSVSLGAIKINKLFRKFKEGEFKRVEDGFNHFLTPDRFCGTDLDDLEGFHVMDWRYLSNLDRWHSYEFWTDSECLIYYIGKPKKDDDDDDDDDWEDDAEEGYIEEAYNSFISDFIINK